MGLQIVKETRDVVFSTDVFDKEEERLEREAEEQRKERWADFEIDCQMLFDAMDDFEM